jgi:hypothetical protein
MSSCARYRYTSFNKGPEYQQAAVHASLTSLFSVLPIDNLNPMIGDSRLKMVVDITAPCCQARKAAVCHCSACIWRISYIWWLVQSHLWSQMEQGFGAKGQEGRCWLCQTHEGQEMGRELRKYMHCLYLYLIIEIHSHFIILPFCPHRPSAELLNNKSIHRPS